jgi:hypothetical protein
MLILKMRSDREPGCVCMDGRPVAPGSNNTPYVGPDSGEVKGEVYVRRKNMWWS